jgi:hypothetical protein
MLSCYYVHVSCGYVLSSYVIRSNQPLVLFCIVYYFATLCTHLKIYYESFEFSYVSCELYMYSEIKFITRSNARAFVLVIIKVEIL